MMVRGKGTVFQNVVHIGTIGLLRPSQICTAGTTPGAHLTSEPSLNNARAKLTSATVSYDGRKRLGL